jgi:class 3 adenylate cyclase
LTQAVLADRAGLSVRGIQHLESGETQPYRHTVKQLAEALGLSAEQRVPFEAAALPTPRRPRGVARPTRLRDYPTHVLPAGIVTLMLVDVENVPQPWERSGSAPSAAERCSALVRACVERRGGTVVQNDRQGQRSVTVFTHASDAVAAALDLQARLRGDPDPQLSGLRVRVALHSGEADLVDGEYRGSAVEQSTRLLPLVQWGQTLLSEATAVLARDALPPAPSSELRLHDLDDLLLRSRIAHTTSWHSHPLRSTVLA